ncbi:GNAT family N-acetyltransferase [Rhodalgimonas zhirmunskyi]|uniref:GNAT family N-acetyltransferase n=1 Tax=Rhodalgimonas zhirmunskyi TaxID=2964767 RepID=A0AAJ1U8H8_9RHOB|nr:GNAT family N-acetyltransferase [Rhodoalgimonas zhirmunskyi]MDQ2093735.1 GNAT family N-acetyltransferase [Rhodoalgimonas zhirmunskyi]
MTRRIPRRARLWHLPRLARILWAAEPRQRTRDRATDLTALARLIRRGAVLHIPGPIPAVTGPRGFIALEGSRIHALYIHPRARRQGLASRLMAAAQAHAASLDLYTAQDNAPARAFYAAHGFHATAFTNGEGNDDGLPDMRLVWKRNAA